jgi:hypothetical protein
MSNLNDSLRNVTNAIAKINPDMLWFALKETTPVQFSNYLGVFKALSASTAGPMLIQGEYYEGADTNRNPMNPDVSSPFFANQALTNGWGFFHSAYYGKSYSNQVAQGWMDGIDTVHMTGAGGVALANRAATEFGLAANGLAGGLTNRSDLAAGVISGGAIGTGVDFSFTNVVLFNQSGFPSIAIGPNSSASVQAGIAIGNTATTTDDGAISIGVESLASVFDAIAIGHQSGATKQDAIALGANTIVNGIASVGIGTQLNVQSNQWIMLGGQTG